jgi:hypothetical protein
MVAGVSVLLAPIMFVEGRKLRITVSRIKKTQITKAATPKPGSLSQWKGGKA